MPEGFICFWKPEDENPTFGNWSPDEASYFCPIEEREVSFMTSEHALMFGKACLMGDVKIAEKLKTCKTPKYAKTLGRKVSPWDEELWIEQREKIMYRVLFSKFSMNDNIKALLLNTGNKVLIEASPYDKIWGIGLKASDSGCGDVDEWKGLNILGRVLMKVREDLANTPNFVTGINNDLLRLFVDGRQDVRHIEAMLKSLKKTMGSVPTSLEDYVSKLDSRGAKFYQLYEPEEWELKTIVEATSHLGWKFSIHFCLRWNLAAKYPNLRDVAREAVLASKYGGRLVIHTGSWTDNPIQNRAIEKFLYMDEEDLSESQKKKLQTWKKASDVGIKKVVEKLNNFDFPRCGISCPILLEPPAGEGKKLMWSFEQMKRVYRHIPEDFGMCLDTCHTFGAGMCRFNTAASVQKLFHTLHDVLGDIKRLKLVHLNDSKHPYRSLKDEHENLMEGYIWHDEESCEGLIELFRQCKKFGIHLVCELKDFDNLSTVQIIKDLM